MTWWVVAVFALLAGCGIILAVRDARLVAQARADERRAKAEFVGTPQEYVRRFIGPVRPDRYDGPGFPF